MTQLTFNFTMPDKKEIRQAGKVKRKEQTDAIKQFVDYSKAQGSKGADHYYSIFSKLIQCNLIGSCKDRNDVDVFSLSTLAVGDTILATELRSGMANSLPYKEIFSKARDKIEGLAISLGKTPKRLAKK